MTLPLPFPPPPQGFEYTRALNPNRLAFETLIASLELPDGHETPQTLSSEERTRTENLPHALAFSSGSSVTQAIITSLVSAGGHVLCVNDCYGGTYRYLTKMGPISNISTTFVEMSASLDVQDIEEYRNSVSTRVEAAFQPDTQVSASGSPSAVRSAWRALRCRRHRPHWVSAPCHR